MAGQGRNQVGFADALNDLGDDWTSTDRPVKPRPDPIETRKAAEAAGFRSREPAKASEPPKPVAQQRRRRTGRNVQFNIKTKAETIEAFTAIADANGWGLGETLEKALTLLEREAGRKSDSR